MTNAFFFLLVAVSCIQLPLLHKQRNYRARSLTGLSGQEASCYSLELNIDNTSFLVLVDTGSSDTVVPIWGINNYAGPTVNITVPGSATSVRDSYGDGSYWNGFLHYVTIGISPNMHANATVYLAYSQSTHPPFMSGSDAQGLMGLAFNPLSQSKDIVIDEWYKQGIIQSNTVEFHGCSDYFLDRGASAWIDFGNQVPYIGCRNETAVIPLVAMDYYRVFLVYYKINGTAVRMNSVATIFDSCTTGIMLDGSVLRYVQDAILSCDGCVVDEWRTSEYMVPWLEGQIEIEFADNEINLDLFPTISFVFQGTNGTLQSLTIGARQYVDVIQGAYIFLISSNDLGFNILGTPFYAAYHILHDRTNGLLYFANGCGCDDSVPLPSIATTTVNQVIGNSTFITTATPTGTSSPVVLVDGKGMGPLQTGLLVAGVGVVVMVVGYVWIVKNRSHVVSIKGSNMRINV